MEWSCRSSTLTIFNSSSTSASGWEGKLRTVEFDIRASVENPQIMGRRLRDYDSEVESDPDCEQALPRPTATPARRQSIVDALTSFGRTLVTPHSKFDRWLAGDGRCAVGYRGAGWILLFKSLGCVSCHWGVVSISG